MMETGPAMRPEELKLLSNLILILENIRECTELELNDFEDEVIKILIYFRGFMLHGINKEETKNV